MEEGIVPVENWLRQAVSCVCFNGWRVRPLNVLLKDVPETHVLDQEEVKVVLIRLLHGIDSALG